MGPGRSRRVSLGESSRSEGAGPGKSVSMQAFRSEGSDSRNLESVSMQALRGEGSDGRHLSSWLLDPLLSSFFPAYVTSLGA